MKKFQIIINTHWHQFLLLKADRAGLAKLFKLKIGTKMMSLVNLDRQGRFIN